MTKHWKGSLVAIVTPFNTDGSIDYIAYSKLLKFHLDNNTNGIIVCGTTGEAASLSGSEYAEIIKFTTDNINGKLPVIAGTGSNCTRTSVENSILAESLGVDGVLVVSPYYNKPTEKGMYQHFKTVADSIKIPVILYNVPGRTAVNMSVNLIIKLANEIDNIVAVKEASGDLVHMANILRNKPDGFMVFSGDDALAFQAVCMGADGVISVVANIIPAEFSKLMKLSSEASLNSAREIYYKYLPLIDACFVESNPIPVKTALAEMNLINETFRLPLCSMETENKKVIVGELENLNLVITK